MKDFREKWVLNAGDTIVSGEYIYTITGAPLGYGGSSILYPAKRTGSELCYAIKECFPNVQGRFERKNGVATLITEDDTESKKLLEFYREMFQKERIVGQSIRNSTGRSIGMWETFCAQTVTTDNQTYDASQGIYALLERMDGKGCSLPDILKECREEVSSLYPLRTGGLPSIYTTACIMEQILRAVQGIHESGYLFGDIQVNNIFFMDSHLGEGNIGFGCLFDFGCARPLLEDGYTEEITDCKIFSTEGYVPPEVLHDNNGHLRLGKQADVYSAGKLMLLCLLTDGQDLIETSRSMKRLLQSYHGKKIGCGGARLELVNAILEKALRTESQERYRDAKDMLGDILKLKKLSELPKFRLQKNMSSPDYFVPGSREKEIKALKESMLKGEYPMLWGYGGMGKTETAIELAKRMENGKGAYLVHFKNSMRETILDLKFSGYRYEPDKRLSLEEQEEREYQERLNLLKDYYEDSIIIIDNFDNEEKTLDELRRERAFTELIGLNLRIIFTTRYPVGRKEWEITELAREELLNIMKYYLKSISVSDEKLYELIDAAGSHTLTVVLMAKTLEESWGTVTPDMILEAFRKASISENSFPEVVSDQNRTYSQEQIYQHLKVLFNLSGMSENEKKVLSYAVLLPEGGMDAIIFMDCLKKEEQKCLRKLVAKGWLRRQEGNLLTIYPIIRQVCREELRPNDEVCEGFLDNLWEKYDKTDYNFLYYIQLAECFVLASEYLKDERGSFSNTAGLLYYDIGEYQRGLECYKKTLRIKEEILPSNHSDLAVIYNNIGISYESMGEYEKGLEYCQKALKIQEEILLPTHPDLAVTYNNIGILYVSMGKYERGLEYYQKALRIQKEVLSSTHPNMATSYDNIGCVYVNMGEYENGLEYYKKALRIQKEILPSNHPDMAVTYNNIGYAYGRLGEYRKELEYYRKALRIQEEILPFMHPNIASTYSNIGYVYANMGEYEKELEYYQKALRIRKEILLPTHPDMAITYNNLGCVYRNMGEYEKSLEYYQEALSVIEKILSPTHPNIAAVYDNIGGVYGDLGKYEKAVEYHKRALRIQKELLPFIHPGIAVAYNNIGYVYGRLGKYKKELGYYQKALRIQEELLPSTHPDLAVTYNNIGYAYGNMGKPKKQLEYYQKALRVQEEILPPIHPDLATVYNNIGLLYVDMGEYEKGLEYCEKMLGIREKLLPAIHPDMATAYNDVGYAYINMKEYKNGLKYCQKALKIWEIILPPIHANMVTVYDNIGYVYVKMEEYSEGLKYYKKALRIQEELLPSTHVDLLTKYNSIGILYGRQGEYEKALKYYEKALRIQEEILPPNHLELVTAYSNIGYVYEELEEYNKAIEYLQKSLEIKAQIFPQNHPDLVEGYYNAGRYYSYINNMKQSYAYYQKAAEGGYILGMIGLANYLIDGKYCEQNYKAAFEWLNKAHILGSSTATNNLAWMYLHGYGCKKDVLKAMELFEMAASSEIPSKTACKHLGDLYLGLEDTENIVSYDKFKALYYYQRAKLLGYRGLEDKIDELLSLI